ncbi:MBL fold metallo-hydrolase [Pseudomonas sp. DC3200b2]|uniref:MBL fold metallo-hydrolase n=1 Tax=Pseudomonas sp. DC3200b2 TaxID=2804669 RepID=UPI003CE9BF1C
MDFIETESYRLEAFFDPATSTLSYLLLDRTTQACAVVDPVLDYHPATGHTDTTSADRLVARVQELGGRLAWILETHVHADHLTAASYLQQALGGSIGIGDRIGQVQATFERWFPSADGHGLEGRPFDRLFADEDRFQVGRLNLRVLHTPGHTPACVSYVLDGSDAPLAFVGDTLFSPDYGTARCDFPGASAACLYHSIQRLLSLPGHTQLLLCHDYRPNGRALVWRSSVAEQRAHNLHLQACPNEASFVALRQQRDATLGMPALMLPAVQVNVRAGRLPAPQANGVRYLSIPLNLLKDAP